MDISALGGMGATTWDEGRYDDLQEDSEFLQLLKNFDETQETDAQRRQRRAAEAQQAADAHRLRQKRIELLGRIAQLRSRVAAGGTPADAAQLSALQTELFWLMSSL